MKSFIIITQDKKNSKDIRLNNRQKHLDREPLLKIIQKLI
jgi:uncharacterized protein YciI